MCLKSLFCSLNESETLSLKINYIDQYRRKLFCLSCLTNMQMQNYIYKICRASIKEGRWAKWLSEEALQIVVK